MPKLLSEVNGSSAVGISSDGTDLGDMTTLNFESNRIKFDTGAGIATVYSDPLTVVGL